MSGPVHAIIISQGSELTRGEIQDSNARFLAAALTARGVTIVGIEVSPDEPGLIAAALGRAAGRAELVICTGGLGPTVDDRTAEAVGIAFGMPLEMREDALGQIVAHWERRGRRMPEASRKLALLPKGCAILANPIGTAPGFRVRTGGTDLYFLPGVPHEAMDMWDEVVLPRITARFGLEAPLRVTFHTCGVGESALQGLIADLIEDNPDVDWAFETRTPENRIKLVVPRSLPRAVHRFEALKREAAERLGIHAFGTDGALLPAVVGGLLVERGENLATAESCTAGGLSRMITEVSGSSAWFDRGWITYSNASKTEQLGIPTGVLESHGAVSEEVARMLARAARLRSGATWALSITGIAGPGGGTPQKPVGTVWVGRSGPTGDSAQLLQLFTDRRLNRRYAAWAALDLLRRHIIERS